MIGHAILREIVGADALRAVAGADLTFAVGGDGGTLLTMRSVFANPEALAVVRSFGAEELGNQTIGKLAAYLEGGAP